MSDVYFIVIPVVIVVVILKLCLIFWRIWLYQKRRERVYLVQQNSSVRRTPQQQQQQQQRRTTARVVGVERSLGPEGFTQRTSYVVNQPGLPARQLTRTIVIRPNDNRRPNDPNLPPSYNHAVTGQDKSVKVESKAVAERDLGPPPMAVQPSAPPIISLAPPADITGVPPPEYSVQAPSAPPQTNSSYYDSSGSNEETRLLLP